MYIVLLFLDSDSDVNDSYLDSDSDTWDSAQNELKRINFGSQFNK